MVGGFVELAAGELGLELGCVVAVGVGAEVAVAVAVGVAV
jgi:hypothetical protein